MRIKRFEKYTQLLIEWVDITEDSKWLTHEEVGVATPVTVKTLGFFISNKKSILNIAHSVCVDGDSDIMHIPWGCIKNIRIVEIKDGSGSNS